MNDFRNTLSDSQLGDLGFSGQKFTWNNGRSGAGNTLERLDRAVANPGWCNLFDVMEVQVLPCCSLDHIPLFVSFSNSTEVLWTKRRQFWIEAACVKNEHPKTIIKKEWIKVPKRNFWDTVNRKLSRCRKSLQVWVRKSAKKEEHKIQGKTQELHSLQQLSNPELCVQERELQKDIQSLLEQEDVKWRQREKINWLKEGDRNAKFFHACANQRSRGNHIS
ncbi:uncharacterized protein LOC133866306 [Alnus glutinosa]|uniref:uncharacterized protein LOC133866306 n=1 Tax=Alnus glutinosa TaxID=3517 RepID=UPI002D7994EC|nr:uncharacterized protein LOC133866306 [Alnus glutinosa]